MSLVAIVVGIGIAFALALFKALALDEVRGRIQRRAEASVEATISSLPPELQEEWAEEWRGELAAMRSMPLSAVAFARGLRRTALQLAGAAELSPARERTAPDRPPSRRRIAPPTLLLPARRARHWLEGLLGRFYFSFLPAGIVLIVLGKIFVGLSLAFAMVLAAALVVATLVFLDDR